MQTDALQRICHNRNNVSLQSAGILGKLAFLTLRFEQVPSEHANQSVAWSTCKYHGAVWSCPHSWTCLEEVQKHVFVSLSIQYRDREIFFIFFENQMSAGVAIGSALLPMVRVHTEL